MIVSDFISIITFSFYYSFNTSSCPVSVYIERTHASMFWFISKYQCPERALEPSEESEVHLIPGEV